MRGNGWLLLLLAAIGCNHDRPLAFIAVDAAAPHADLAAVAADAATTPEATPDLAAPDLAAAPRPCQLVSAGDPVTTVSYDNPASSWHCEGLLARGTPPNHLIHYGNVSLRFGGWDDPAIVATELDVTGWPPAVISAPSMLYFSMHSPASMFELDADTLGMSWSFDNDGIGPAGVQYKTVNANTWRVTDAVFLSDYMGVQGPPVAINGGAQFAITYHTPRQAPDANMLLGIFGRDGTLLSNTVVAHAGSSYTLAVERTATDLLVAAAYSTCSASDPAFCEKNSLVILRATGGTSASSPLQLQKLSAVPARNPMLQLSAPVILSDHDRTTFLAWWELGDHQSYLFAVPLSAAGQPAGPVEVWFTSTQPVTPGRASIGAVGVVFPVALSVSTDGGSLREVHLIQRQLLVDAPVSEISYRTATSSFVIATAQFDNPRSLLVGYSNYPEISGTAGFGVLAKYVCGED